MNGFKEIHSRLTQNLNGRKIYLIDKLVNNPNVENSIPKEFYDLSNELYGENLLKPKLSTVDKLKAMNKLRKGLKSGRINKYGKKGQKIVRNGVPIKDVLYGNYDGYDENNTDPEYQKKFGKKGKYGKYGKFGSKMYGKGMGHGHSSGRDPNGDFNC